MEPLFFKAENPAGLKRRRRNNELQWSRFFSKRKILAWCGRRDDRNAASMEPLFFKAENAVLYREPTTGKWASMEPLFFKAENIPDGGIEPVEIIPLQWSRFFSKRKIREPMTVILSAKGFNGAAFFQSGKSRPRRRVRKRRLWLQWSRFFSKRKICPN